ncbi:nitroreductase/quinone reductase family protein, partial [Priestia megaterium]|uniref:nitroreductase/quinone reductase family protein n=1 Tax=Priestia megaterium TaxID=1404 RepID=UPI0035B58CC2
MPLEGDYGPSTADWVRTQAEAYERWAGRKAETLGGRPIIVLTTKGAKSGLLHKTALMRVEHDG